MPSAASAIRAASPFRVLVVEDDLSFVQFLRDSLLTLSPDLEVTVATRLSAAMTALETHAFDAVLLDLNLPDSSGLSTLQRITSTDSHVPVVVLTGTHDAGQGQDAMRLGAQDWLTKPQPEPEVVLRALRYAAERKRLTEGLIRSQKLEAVGQLARNVAHEFNNLLTTIIGNVGLAASDTDAHMRERALAEIEQAATRGALLTRQLLGFARPRAAGSVVADVTQAMTTVRDLCQAVLPRAVAIRLDSQQPAWVPLAQEQLEQVLLNLVLNARDAIAGSGGAGGRGGTITMAATRTGGRVRIEVQDTGTGIHPDALPHVFEPFFTTKGDSGTGLGLVIAKELIEQAGGTIQVESRYQQGTTIRIELPSHVAC